MTDGQGDLRRYWDRWRRQSLVAATLMVVAAVFAIVGGALTRDPRIAWLGVSFLVVAALVVVTWLLAGRLTRREMRVAAERELVIQRVEVGAAWFRLVLALALVVMLVVATSGQAPGVLLALVAVSYLVYAIHRMRGLLRRPR